MGFLHERRSRPIPEQFSKIITTMGGGELWTTARMFSLLSINQPGMFAPMRMVDWSR